MRYFTKEYNKGVKSSDIECGGREKKSMLRKIGNVKNCLEVLYETH